MNPEQADADDQQFGEFLAAYDEALAAGAATPPADDTSVPPELRDRLRRARAFLDWLEGQRRSAGPEPLPGPAPPDAAAVLAFDPARGTGQVGRFRLLRELGRGGGGVVFLAFDPRLGREVALKVPRPETLLTPELRGRFLREARAAAGLDHPHLVPVFDAGEAGPCGYIVSAYCRGPTLRDWLDDRAAPAPPRAAARLLVGLAEAVHYLHGRGVLHRDIKPGNVLLEPREAGAAPAGSADEDLGFVARLTDFGLARLEGDATRPTRTGAVLGTPAYMAPEQAEGRTREVGPAADVYALGAVLYELLTGRPPFRGGTDLNTLRQVLTEDPAPPRRLRPGLPRDLESVCLKCLEKDPSRRYASAGDLAADLNRFLDGQPTRARPAGIWRRIARWARRRPFLAAAPAVVGVVVWGLLAAASKPPSAEEIDRETARKLQAELDEHRVLTLIPATGFPRYYRWRLNQVLAHRTSEGAFAFGARGPSLVELLPAVPGKAFRFSAEVQHRGADLGGEVGIYFGYGRRDTPRGVQHSYCKLVFNDLLDVARKYPRQNLPGNQAALSCVLLFEKPTGELKAHGRAVGLNAIFRPAVTAPGPWRRLAVEVRPDSLCLGWGARPPVGPLPRAALERHADGLFRDQQVPRRDRPDPRLSQALGVYLANGAAAFRNVKLELLDDPP